VSCDGAGVEWLEIRRSDAPLIVSFPHTGTEIPRDLEQCLVCPWRGRKDTDWWVHELYDGVSQARPTTIRTAISRTVIDVNRDPAGISLYPGQATTDLCPLTTFDGEPLYKPSREPDAPEIARRRARFFDPYHAALAAEIERLRLRHGCVVLYDAHSIRSRVPRLFEGDLPDFNVGTNHDTTCDPALTRGIETASEGSRFTRVTNGRFRGGWTTRRYGQPGRGVHAVQMELACRSYLDEPADALRPDNWPPAYDPTRAEEARTVLGRVLLACVEFAERASRRPR
jgi:N-formylglutamate deformylase